MPMGKCQCFLSVWAVATFYITWMIFAPLYSSEEPISLASEFGWPTQRHDCIVLNPSNIILSNNTWACERTDCVCQTYYGQPVCQQVEMDWTKQNATLPENSSLEILKKSVNDSVNYGVSLLGYRSPIIKNEDGQTGIVCMELEANCTLGSVDECVMWCGPTAELAVIIVPAVNFPQDYLQLSPWKLMQLFPWENLRLHYVSHPWQNLTLWLQQTIDQINATYLTNPITCWTHRYRLWLSKPVAPFSVHLLFWMFIGNLCLFIAAAILTSIMFCIRGEDICHHREDNERIDGDDKSNDKSNGGHDGSRTDAGEPGSNTVR